MIAKRNAMFAALPVVAAGLAFASWWSFRSAGTGSLGSGPVDALVVFGSPAEIDGAPSPMQTWRVREGVAEYQRGVAGHLIFSGGAAANRFVEADVMAREAAEAGVPATAILTERHSLTTLQNLRGVSAIMQAHGWTSAEFISSADHLPRIAVIARPVPFRWRLHAAPTPGRGRVDIASSYAEESAAILVLRSFGTAAEPVVHAVAVCEHALVFFPKWIVWKLHHHAPAAKPNQ